MSRFESTDQEFKPGLKYRRAAAALVNKGVESVALTWYLDGDWQTKRHANGSWTYYGILAEGTVADQLEEVFQLARKLEGEYPPPKTPGQVAFEAMAKTAFARFQGSWSHLTDDIQAGWEAAAKAAREYKP